MKEGLGPEHPRLILRLIDIDIFHSTVATLNSFTISTEKDHCLRILYTHWTLSPDFNSLLNYLLNPWPSCSQVTLKAQWMRRETMREGMRIKRRNSALVNWYLKAECPQQSNTSDEN